jgi:hypothetical protein
METNTRTQYRGKQLHICVHFLCHKGHFHSVKCIENPVSIMCSIHPGMSNSFSWRLNNLVVCLKFSFCHEWVKGNGLEHKKMSTFFTLLNTCKFHPFNIELYCSRNSTRTVLFPTAGDCFSFEFRWILSSVLATRAWVGLLWAECNILNAYKRGKITLLLAVRGSQPC